MQLQSSLDQSLLDARARRGEAPALSQLTDDSDVPSWALGAGDVRMAFVDADGRGRMLDRDGRRSTLGQPRARRGARAQRLEHPHRHASDGERYRVVAVPRQRRRPARWSSRSPWTRQEQVLDRARRR